MFTGPSEDGIKKERTRARQLRQSRWWRQKVAASQCYYCDCEIAGEQVTMDHVVPLARGGRSEKNNIVPACKACNSKKKSELPWELV